MSILANTPLGSFGPASQLLADRRLRWFAVVTGACLVPVMLAPVSAPGAVGANVTQTEVVQVGLAGSGTPARIKAAETFEVTGSGEVPIEMSTDLTDIQAGSDTQDLNATSGHVSLVSNVTSSAPGTPSFSGNAKLLDADGTVNTPKGARKLPAQVTTQFSFNGAPVTDLADIAGGQGHFRMEITVENRTGVPQEVTYFDSIAGRNVSRVGMVFVPLTVRMGPWHFDGKNWANLAVKGGVLNPQLGNSVITSESILFPPASSGRATLVVEGDTRSFDLDSGKITMRPGIHVATPDVVKAAQAGLKGMPAGELAAGLFQLINLFQALQVDLPEIASLLAFILADTFGLIDDLEGQLGTFADALELEIGDIDIGLAGIIGILQTAAPELSDIMKRLGDSRYFNPACRASLGPGGDQIWGPSGVDDSVLASLCDFGPTNGFPGDVAQQPMLPPVPALDNIQANARNGAGAAGTSDLERNVLRAAQGSTWGDLMSTKALGSNEFAGSIYNWTALLYAASQPAIVANLGSTADFPEFYFPDPTGPLRSLYDTRKLDSVVIRKGELWPGNALDPSLPTPSGPVAGLCSMSGEYPPTFLSPNLTGRGWDSNPTFATKADQWNVSCGNVPAADITLADLLTPGAYKGNAAGGNWQTCVTGNPNVNCNWFGPGPAEQKMGTATATIENLLAAKECSNQNDPTSCTFKPALNTGANLTLELDFGQLLAHNTFFGIHRAAQSQPLVDNTPPPNPKSVGFTMTCRDLTKVSSLLSWNAALKAVLKTFCGTDTSTGAGPFTVDYSTVSIDNRDAAPSWGQSILGSPVGTGNQIGCFFPLSMFLPPGTSLTCDWALTGQLGAIQGASQVSFEMISNPTWNFDNFVRGDPGFQVTDSSAVTGPHVGQALNMILFILDRSQAMCPATAVTFTEAGKFPGLGGTGTGTPRVVPPPLDTPCDLVYPPDADKLYGIIPTDGISALQEVDELLGVPGEPKYIARSALPPMLDSLFDAMPASVASIIPDPVPANLATLLPALVNLIDTEIDVMVKGPLEDSIPPGIVQAQQGAAEALLASAAVDLLVAVPVFQAFTNDMTAALSKAGLKRLSEQGPFFGTATVGGGGSGAMDAAVIFTYEVQGTKQDGAT